MEENVCAIRCVETHVSCYRQSIWTNYSIDIIIKIRKFSYIALSIRFLVIPPQVTVEHILPKVQLKTFLLQLLGRNPENVMR